MKRLLALLLSATMVLGFTGCGASSTGDTAKSDEKVPEVTIGTTSWPTNMFFYLANEKGFFDKEGVKVKIQDFSSTTVSTGSTNPTLSNNCNSLNFCTFASSETVAPYFQGGDIAVVLETDKSNGSEGLVAKSDIKSVKDLKGKSIATQLYSVDHMFLLTLLAENGMTEKDVNIVDMSIQECDAACIWDPYFSQAIASGGTKLYSSSDNPNLITDVLCTSNKLCEENPDVVEAVVRGFFDAVEYWKSNPDEANKFMGDKLGVGEEEFKKEIDGLIITDPSSVKTAFTPAEDYSYWGYTQNTIRDFMYELGVLKNKDKDCGDMINNTFVEKIAAEK